MSGDVADKTQGGVSGRGNGSGGNGAVKNGDVIIAHHTSRAGSVVIRATVEHIGVVGETEMTINVKWPASSFCAPSCEEKPAEPSQSAGGDAVPKNGPGAFILKAVAPVTPSKKETTERPTGAGAKRSAGSETEYKSEPKPATKSSSPKKNQSGTA